MKNLQGKTALVTGASSGLGAEFARLLARNGCNLILVARRAERLSALQSEITTRYGVSVDPIAMDLGVADAPQCLHDQLRQTDRTVDLLINNAGLGVYGEFLTAPWEELKGMLDLDIMVLTHMTRLFGADMVKRGHGHVLLVASTGAFQPTPTYGAYAAAKSYVLSLGEALHSEWAGSGVNCTVLCPGVTRTEFFDVTGQTLTAYQRMTMMDSTEVAQIGIKAMLKGRSCLVAGRLNSLMAFGTRLFPRQVLARMAASAMGGVPSRSR